MTYPLPVEVLVVVNSLEIGGLERMATDLCLGMRDRFRMGAVCLREQGPFAEELRDHGIPVYAWSGMPAGRLGYWTAPLRLRRLLRRMPVRVVHSHNITALINGVFATRGRSGVRLVHTDHARQFPDKARRMWLERVCAKGAYRIVAVSEQSKRDLVEWEHIPADRIQVIGNGVNTEPFTALAPPRFAPEQEIVLGIAARLQEEKAHTDLLEAVRLLGDAGLRVRLRIAGDGPLRGRLEERARSLGIAERVEFLGYQEDIAAFTAGVHISVLSSVREGMPLSLLEAMAAARPVVATSVGGVPEVVVHGETGLLVPPRQPEALAHALHNIITDPARAAAMGVAGRQRVRAQFSMAHMLDRYAALYNEALRAGASTGPQRSAVPAPAEDA